MAGEEVFAEGQGMGTIHACRFQSEKEMNAYSTTLQLDYKYLDSSAVIEKRRYWSKYVEGDAIDILFKDREVGDMGSHAEKLQQERFVIFWKKEEDFVIRGVLAKKV
jgi:hypothetical protein